MFENPHAAVVSKLLKQNYDCQEDKCIMSIFRNAVEDIWVFTAFKPSMAVLLYYLLLGIVSHLGQEGKPHQNSN